MKKFSATNLIATGLIAIALIAAAPARAETQHFTYDSVHTQVMFSVSHLGFSHSHGRFTKFSGGFSIDEAKPEEAKADITIQTNSLVMDSVEWENHLKNPDFFDVAKYPTMTFKSTSVEKTGDNTAKLVGDLTLLGVTKPVILDVTFNKGGIHPYSKKYVMGFSATGKLQRSEFGMNYGLPGIGDEVTLDIQVEGVAQDAPAAKTEAETAAPAETPAAAEPAKAE